MTKTNILVLIKVLKTSSEDVWVRRICSSWSRHLEDVFKTSSRGLHQDECLLGLFYSELCWRFWNLGVANFLRKTLLLLVKTDFLASRSSSFSDNTVFLSKCFIPYGGDGFSVFWKLFSLISSFFFYKRKSSLKLVETILFWRLCSGRKVFSFQWKLFFLFRASFLRAETVTEASWNK